MTESETTAPSDDATFPGDGVELTHILVVRQMTAARSFYRDVLGARVVRQYGGSSCVLQFQGAWLLLVTPGGATEDKPGVSFAPVEEEGRRRVSHSMTIRVPDCRKAYEELRSRGAQFLTPPLDRGSEVRCFFRDPDGHLLEISESVEGGDV